MPLKRLVFLSLAKYVAIIENMGIIYNWQLGKMVVVLSLRGMK
jgi:hypothetical protein